MMKIVTSVANSTVEVTTNRAKITWRGSKIIIKNKTLHGFNMMGHNISYKIIVPSSPVY